MATCHCAGGWICETHPDQPWQHDACAGPGMPCDNNELCPWWAGGRPRAMRLDRSFVDKPDRESEALAMADDQNENRQMIGAMLHAVEHVLTAAENAAVMCEQLIKAERSGKTLATSTLTHYEEQLAGFEQHRGRLRELLGQVVDAARGRIESSLRRAETANVNRAGVSVMTP